MCFYIFGKNSKIQNGRHFWGGENFLKIAKSTFLKIPCGSQISTKSLYLPVKETETNLCFAIFGKNSKIQNGRIFGEGKFFLKIAKSTLNERISYFKIKIEETLWYINLDPSMFPYNFFTVIPLFIMGSPVEVYFRFHVFLFMSVNCCMCLTTELRKSPNRKQNCRKSHSRKLVYEQIIPEENTQTFICYMVYTTWQCLCKCVMYHLVRGLLY